MLPPLPNPQPLPGDSDPDLVLLERSIFTLQELGKRKPLRSEEKRQTEEAARNIRESAFSDEEQSALSNGAYQESTIKGKAKGAGPKDPSIKERAAELMAQMVSQRLTFQNVRDSISMKAVLDANKTKLEDVAALIGQARNSGVELQEIVSHYQQMKQQGISPEQSREVLAYKEDLNRLGITISNDGGLKQIALIAKSHGGDVNKIIGAINKQGGLPALEKKAGDLRSSIDRKEKRVIELDGEIKSREARRSELQVPLERLDRVLALGFEEQSFDQIYQMATYGEAHRSVKEIVEGLARYSSLLDLERDISDLCKKRDDAESDLRQFEAEHAHRQTLLDMCEVLLYKYKFSLPAFKDLVRIAKDYGEPIVVFDALAKYDNIQSLKQEVVRLEKSRAELEVKLAELESRNGELRAKADAITEFITASINPLKEEFKRAAADLERTYHTNITLLKTEAAEYGKRLGEAKYLEESLKLARFMHLIIKVPSDAAAFPIDYAVFILDGIEGFCIAKNVNPKINLEKTFAQLGTYQLNAVPVVTVIDIVRRTLKQYTNVI